MPTEIHFVDPKSSVAPYTYPNQSRFIARALVLALLFSRLSAVTASPLPSIPASAPGFRSGALSRIHDHKLNDPWRDTSDLHPAPAPAPAPASAPAMESDFEEANEEGHLPLEHEALANTDGRMGVDGMGNAIAKGPDSSVSLPSSSRPPKPNRDPDGIDSGPLGLLPSLILGFWQGLLGSFFVFWLLIASTVGTLVLVAHRLAKLQRTGLLTKWSHDRISSSSSRRRRSTSTSTSESRSGSGSGSGRRKEWDEEEGRVGECFVEMNQKFFPLSILA